MHTSRINPYLSDLCFASGGKFATALMRVKHN